MNIVAKYRLLVNTITQLGLENAYEIRPLMDVSIQI